MSDVSNVQSGTEERPGASSTDKAAPVSPHVDEHGTVHYAPRMVIPFSPLASPEAKAAFADRTPAIPPDYFEGNPFSLDRIAGTRAWFRDNAQRLIEQHRELYPVEIEQTHIAGIPVEIVTPHGGVKHPGAVLINLHGGGFVFGQELGLIEAIPIACTAGMTVLTVDYRMGPEHRFPAASEDVAKVYAALLQSYDADRIGIYGCSAGGTLTMQAVAWFQQHDLPPPGAIGVICAGGIASPTAFPPGDSKYTSRLFTGAPMPRPDATVPQSLLQYHHAEDLDQELSAPARFPEILARFPPTVIVAGTRDFALSNAAWTHAQLVKQGVEAGLHVWEGVGHGFQYRPDLPESHEVYDVIATFFRRHLTR